jgi:fructose/tagatose bisphosphate aldolase
LGVTEKSQTMYVTKPRLFFDYAFRNRFAVPSFNVCNLEIARAVVAAAEAEDAPVILQTYFGDLYYGGFGRRGPHGVGAGGWFPCRAGL